MNLAADYYKGVASGDPGQLSRFKAGEVNLSKMAFDQAQKQIERTLPKGGVRDQALGDLATRQAGEVTRILSGGVQEALAHLEGIGQFGTQGSLSALGLSGNAGDSLARLSAAKAAAVGQGIAGIAGGIGQFAGMGSARPAGGGTGRAVGIKPPPGPISVGDAVRSPNVGMWPTGNG